MKISLFTTLSLWLLPLSLCAMDLSISYATFYSPAQNYVEVYMHVAGKSVTFQPVSDSTFQAQLEVTLIFKQGGDIHKFDKFNLNSPLAKGPVDFVDLKRYGLDNGAYELVALVKDKNKLEDQNEYQASFTIDYQKDAISQSDIMLLASYKKAEAATPFVKNGLALEPLPYNFYDRYTSALIFYSEIYHSNKALSEDFMVSYSIERIDNGKTSTAMIGHKRKKPQAVIPVLIQMDISKLESGNYNLVLEVRTSGRELLSRKAVFFQRSNPFYNAEPVEIAQNIDVRQEFVADLSPEQLKFSLRAITPKLPPNDVEFVNSILKQGKLDEQRLYLFSFWAQESPVNPQAAFQKFTEVAKAIDSQFRSGFRYGFETDRGYIYIKYGQPDDIEARENEPSAPPYEVWTYYDFPMTSQSNVKFIFYNPSLAAGDYILLHSTARGEIFNPRWEVELYRDAPNELQGNNYLDGEEMQDNYSRNARRVWRDY